MVTDPTDNLMFHIRTQDCIWKNEKVSRLYEATIEQILSQFSLLNFCDFPEHLLSYYRLFEPEVNEATVIGKKGISAEGW